MTGADAATLLARLADAGLTVRADGADLVVSPGARLSAELRAAIAAGKTAMLAALSGAVRCPDCGGWCLRHPCASPRDGRAHWCADRRRCGRVVWIAEGGG
jgi:hypothetical protein